MTFSESSEEKPKAQLLGTLYCREVFQSPSYSPGEGIRGEIGLQLLPLNECLVSLDHNGGEEKSERIIQLFSVSCNPIV